MSQTKTASNWTLFVFVGFTAFLIGCAVPPRPPWAPPPQPVTGEDDNGWLFRQQHQAQAPAPPANPPAPAQPGTSMPPPVAPGTLPPSGYPGGYVTPTSYQSAAPGYENYAPQGGYPNTGMPPASPSTGYPNTRYPNTGMPPAPPANPNLMPIGATGAAPRGPDIVPPGVAGPPPVLAPSGQTAAQPVTPVTPAPTSPPKPEDDSGFDIADLSPENVWKGLKNATGFGPDQKIARAAFDEGAALMREKKYADAADKFYTASWRWPDSALEEDAMFMLGECYFFQDRYSKAHDAFGNLLKKHENTRYLDTVMKREFAIGRYWDELDVKQSQWPTTPNVTDKTRPVFDTFGNALAAYDSVRLHDPTGPLADLAVMAVANAHFRKGHFEDAAYHYDLIRKDYPKSRFQKQAHILGLQAAERIYQGPMYDKAPLDRSKEIAKQTLTQFRGQLGTEERAAREAAALIVEQQAEREWAMAQYYDKKKCFGAAKFYYRNVIKDYPRTQHAERAHARLLEIQNEPDEPPKNFQWLTRWVEHEKK